MMQITVTRAVNGYVLRYYDEETEQERLIAIDNSGEMDSDVVVSQKMLWEIVNFFNLAGSKHDEERIHICRRDRDCEEIKEV